MHPLQALDLEVVRETLQKELADAERRLSDTQDKSRWRERDLSTALDESRAASKVIQEESQANEIRLNTANQDASNLKVRDWAHCWPPAAWQASELLQLTKRSDGAPNSHLTALRTPTHCLGGMGYIWNTVMIIKF